MRKKEWTQKRENRQHHGEYRACAQAEPSGVPDGCDDRAAA